MKTSKTVVALEPADKLALEKAADAEGLPTSALARMFILRGLRTYIPPQRRGTHDQDPEAA